MAKQVTMICELVFELPDNFDVEAKKFDVVDSINWVLHDAGLNTEPQINPNAPMVVTAIEPLNIN